MICYGFDVYPNARQGFEPYRSLDRFDRYLGPMKNSLRRYYLVAAARSLLQVPNKLGT